MDTIKTNPSASVPAAVSPPANSEDAADTTAKFPLNKPRSRAGGTALTVLATIAFIFSLQWAQEFLVPLVFGILVAYTLNPVVLWLERRKVPRVVGTTFVMLVLFGSAAGVLTSVYNQAQSIIDDLPIATYKLNNALARIDDGELGTLDKLRSAADALKKAAAPAPSNDAEQQENTAPSVVKPPDFDLNEWLWTGSLSVAAFAGKLIMILFLVFFALLSGDTFKRKLVKMTGPSLSNKKITVQILDDINTSIQKYMLMLLVTNALLGLVTWVVLYAIGLSNAGAWAAVAGLLHIIPYFGTVITAAATGFAAFLQFESFSMMALVAAATLGIASIVGTLVTTWMTGRIAKMNATAVFVALLFGGWLWGIWGLLLCVPIVVVVKVVSQHIEGLYPLAELLSE